jgi:hypothetical protein
MSAGDKKDWDEFNCSEEYEFTYVKNLYTQPDEVYEWLQTACKSGILNHSTHKEVYILLAQAGFIKNN